jgi:hypothetical protein
MDDYLGTEFVEKSFDTSGVADIASVISYRGVGVDCRITRDYRDGCAGRIVEEHADDM